MKSTGLFHSVECFGKSLSGKEKSLVYQQIMLYLFRGTNQTKIRKFLLENKINFDFVIVGFLLFFISMIWLLMSETLRD